MQQERRQFIRIRSRLTTLIKHLDTGKVRRALTKDISAGGVCLVTEELLKPGTTLGLQMKLPDRETPIMFTAEVVWSLPVGEPGKSYENPTAETGLQFVSIDPKDQALLKQYAATNAPPPER